VSSNTEAFSKVFEKLLNTCPNYFIFKKKKKKKKLSAKKKKIFLISSINKQKISNFFKKNKETKKKKHLQGKLQPFHQGSFLSSLLYHSSFPEIST